MLAHQTSRHSRPQDTRPCPILTQVRAANRLLPPARSGPAGTTYGGRPSPQHPSRQNAVLLLPLSLGISLIVLAYCAGTIKVAGVALSDDTDARNRQVDLAVSHIFEDIAPQTVVPVPLAVWECGSEDP